MSLFSNAGFPKNILKNLFASKIKYDNSTSGLNANNVQTAIDTVKATTDTLGTSVSKKLEYTNFTITTVSATHTLAAGEDRQATFNLNNANYYPIGIVGCGNTERSIELVRYQLTSKSRGSGVATYSIFNTDYGNPRSTIVSLDILWVRAL